MSLCESSNAALVVDNWEYEEPIFAVAGRFSPEHGSAVYALATDHHLFFHDGTADTDHDDMTAPHLTVANERIMDIDWFSERVVAVGCGSGSVRLTDRRARDSTLRLRYDGNVRHVRGIDEWRLLISGEPSKDDMHPMALYDLRKTPAPSPDDDHGTSRPSLVLGPTPDRVAALPPNPPRDAFRSLDLSDYKPTAAPSSSSNSLDSALDARPAKGLDVSRALGLVAAAFCDGSVRLFDIRSGHPVASRLGRVWGERVAALAFVRDRPTSDLGTPRGVRHPGILFGRESAVEEWSICTHYK